MVIDLPSRIRTVLRAYLSFQGSFKRLWKVIESVIWSDIYRMFPSRAGSWARCTKGRGRKLRRTHKLVLTSSKEVSCSTSLPCPIWVMRQAPTMQWWWPGSRKLWTVFSLNSIKYSFHLLKSRTAFLQKNTFKTLAMTEHEVPNQLAANTIKMIVWSQVRPSCPTSRKSGLRHSSSAICNGSFFLQILVIV